MKTNDVVELVYRGKTLEAPIFILPSHADEAITLALGYGQTGSYRLQVDGGEQTFGVNAGLLRHSDALWFDGGLEVRKTRKTYELVQTQTHWTMEDPVPDSVKGLVRKRPIALESTVAAWAAHPGELTRPLRETPPTLLGELEADQRPSPVPVGHGHRPRALHGLQRLRRRLPGREQHPGGGHASR